ncbi:DUF2066 domain-containing protein [Algicola sagamiensis]|uniref:DUF2066 domain-containing protein n=1 Tax=Algicola sagamiensis TaxID=163869 RepID=UPI0003705775|nr:DUF2066 domain-containing protein [Algicola sagamiensis]
MIKSIIKTVFLFVLIAHFPVSASVVIHDLYRAEIQVEEQSNEAKLRAEKDVLKAVLLKVSGKWDFHTDHAIQAQLKKSTNYITRFQYKRGADSQLYFEAEVDKQKVNSLLKNHGYPIMGKRRPRVLFWLAKETPGTKERTILSSASKSQLQQVVTRISKQRAIPVVIPLMDLDDVMRVSTTDIWGRFDRSIVEGSARYEADLHFIGRLFTRKSSADSHAAQNEDQAEPSLVYVAEGSVYEWGKGISTATGISEEEAIANLYNQLMDQMAEQYAVEVSVTGKQLLVTVSQITDVNDFIQVEKVLLAMQAVASVKVVRFVGDTMHLQLKLFGQVKDFQHNLKLDRRFMQEPAMMDESQDDYHLIWQG